MLIHNVKPAQADDLAMRFERRYKDGDTAACFYVPFWIHTLGFPMRARDRAALALQNLPRCMDQRFPRIADLMRAKQTVRLSGDGFSLERF